MPNKRPTTTRVRPIGATRVSATRAIETMLLRHGLAAKEHLPTVTALTGLTYQSAKRRMDGESPWQPEELAALARYFNDAALSVYGSVLNGGSHRAWLDHDGTMTCFVVWAGERFDPATMPAQLVLRAPPEGDEVWRVVSSGAHHADAYCIKAMVGEQTLQPRRVALLVSRSSWLAELGSLLASAVVQYDRFEAVDALHEACTDHAYRGFVVEWRLVRSDAERTLSALRARCGRGALVLLADAGSADAELHECLRRFRATVYEEPYSKLGVANAILQGFVDANLDRAAVASTSPRIASTKSPRRAPKSR